MIRDPMEALIDVAREAVKTPKNEPTVPTVPPSKDLPEAIYESVGSTGQTTLWIVFVIMLFATLAFTFMAWRTPVQKRLFPVLTAFITTFATISYFAMATGDGNAYTHIVITEDYGHKYPDTTQDLYRQIFWARYVDWTVTTPLLLLDLSFLAGLNGANIIVAIVADVVMVVTGLFAAYGNSDGQKWAYYAMGCFAYLFIVYLLAVPGRKAVAAKSNATRTLFGSIALYTFVLWTLYPVVWGFGDGTRILSVDSEIIAYAILDVLAKPIFGFWLLIAHSQIGGANIEGWWSNGLAAEGNLRLGEDDEGA